MPSQKKPWARWRNCYRLLSDFHEVGLPHRCAWAAASLEYPDLALARDAVSLYLGCGHSTGNVERFLKYVGDRDHIARSGSFLRDVMLCMHAPLVKDVAELPHESERAQSRRGITPKGSYLQRVIDAYAAVYGGRAWSKTPKTRRDVGVARRKKGDSEPRTEAAFLRRREVEIRKLEAGSKSEGPASKKVRFRGVDVPSLDEAMDKTAANEKIRESAARRGKAKAAGLSPASVAKAKSDWHKRQQRAEAKRWVGSSGAQSSADTPPVCGGGNTSPVCGGGNAADVVAPGVVVWACPEFTASHADTLHRRQMKGACLQSKSAASKGVVILPMMRHDTLSSSPTAKLAQIFGGFLTTVPWYTATLERRARAPRGVMFQGFCFKTLKVHMSDVLRRKEPLVHLAFRKLHEKRESFTLVDSVDTIDAGVREFVAQRGTRSRPWTRFAVLIHEGEERDALIGDRVGACREAKVVQTLRQFIAWHSVVDRAAVCLGYRDP